MNLADGRNITMNHVHKYHKDVKDISAFELSAIIEKKALKEKNIHLSNTHLSCFEISEDKKSILMCFDKYEFRVSDYIGTAVFIKESKQHMDVIIYNCGTAIIDYGVVYRRVHETLVELGFYELKLETDSEDEDEIYYKS